MPISLTRVQIDAAIPRVKEGLEKYLWLQRNRDAVDVRVNAEYQRKFNRFYRVRRGSTWQGHFYALLQARKRHCVTFRDVLNAIYKATNRYEASFASKLVATIDPTMPVIDSVVLRNLGLRLPPAGAANRLSLIEALHNELATRFSEYLKTPDGRYLVDKFRKTYPSANITEVKMLDLVLWQTRPNPALKRTARKRAAA
jgi:hypothetical protein